MKTDRCTFSRSVTLALAASAVPAWAQGRKNLRIGHTGITWPRGNPGWRRRRPRSGPGRRPRASPPRRPVRRPSTRKAIEQIFIDLSGLGFHGVELFDRQIEGMEAHGGLTRLIDKYRLPLIASYGGPNLTDPAQRKPSLERLVESAKVVPHSGCSSSQ